MLKLLFASDAHIREGECSTVFFEVPNGDFDLLRAVRDACAEYSMTPEGQAVLSEHVGSFDWGDFMQYVPEEICLRHGLKFTDVPQFELICTDYYENLLDEDADASGLYHEYET